MPVCHSLHIFNSVECTLFVIPEVILASNCQVVSLQIVNQNRVDNSTFYFWDTFCTVPKSPYHCWQFLTYFEPLWQLAFCTAFCTVCMFKAFLASAKMCTLFVQLQHVPWALTTTGWFNLLLQKLEKECFHQTIRQSFTNHNISKVIRWIIVCMYLMHYIGFVYFYFSFLCEPSPKLMEYSIFSKVDIWEMLLERSMAQIVFAVRHILSIRYIATAPFISPIAWCQNLLFSRKYPLTPIYSYCFPFIPKRIFGNFQNWTLDQPIAVRSNYWFWTK